MRRQIRQAIVERCQVIDTALQHCKVARDRATGIALIVSGVEALEAEGRTGDELRNLFERILEAPVSLDPRADTRGT